MKKLIFVSTGRCGTKRIAQILKEKLSTQYAVVHQMRYSRIANIVGNVMLSVKESNRVKRLLYEFTISKYDTRDYFISTDPLTAMIIPDEYIHSSDVCIVHVVRDDESFARSFFAFSRSRSFSFIAHNFVPFWQPGLWPVENILNEDILAKYREIWKLKNVLFFKRYSSNPHYRQVVMENIFRSRLLQEIVNKFFDETISISQADLTVKANESRNSC